MAVSCDGGKKLGFGVVSHMQEEGRWAKGAVLTVLGLNALRAVGLAREGWVVGGAAEAGYAWEGTQVYDRADLSLTTSRLVVSRVH